MSRFFLFWLSEELAQLKALEKVLWGKKKKQLSDIIKRIEEKQAENAEND